MARMHLHIAVDDLAQNIDFYSTLFGTPPSVVRDDYAKWMLDDPRVNFAISTRGRKIGLDHVGIQTDTAEELAVIEQRLRAAGVAATEQKGATCCYAVSDKYWTIDPQGIAWESFHSLGSAPTFSGGEPAAEDTGRSCCVPGVAPACC